MKPDREALARIRDAIKRGDRDIDLGDALGVPLSMVRRPDGGMDIRGADGREGIAVHSQMWDPTPTRPADYPADLPFVANVRAAVVTSADASMTTIQWIDPPEPLVHLDALVQQSLAEGWELRTLPPTMAERPGVHRWLVQGDRVRTISYFGSAGCGVLALMQKDRGQDAG